MLDPREFTKQLQSEGYTFFTGVPDSLLKELCACITDTVSPEQHIIAANEGAAVGLAAGHHLGTGEAAVVYMQNSGTGNAINPLLSLADPGVYSIPMLLIIGWRGEPGVKDEPQHIKQGAVQKELLTSLGYSFEILATEQQEAEEQLKRLTAEMRRQQTPVILLVRKNSFEKYTGSSDGDSPYQMSREEALGLLLAELPEESRIVSTTGKTSREIYELRVTAGEGHGKDFLTVGSMGHAVMIALGLAKGQKRPVVCVDGDGAAIMHMGSMAVAAREAPESFVHILINNGAHESVGGQPTIGFDISFATLAKEMGYRTVVTVADPGELQAALSQLRQADGPTFIEVRVRKGARADLGRPKTTPQENKTAFMEAL